MIIPFLIFFFLFTVAPIIVSIFFSFTDFNLVSINNFVGFDNYIRMLLSDKIFLIALRNTLILAVITGPFGFILSFVLAWLINEIPLKLRPLVTFFVYAPSLSANVFVIWQYLFSSDSYGLINSIAMRLGFITSPISWLTDSSYNLTVVIIVSVWMSFSSGFLSFRAGFQSLDRAYFEAAAIDGLRNRWQELYYVSLPQMGPQLMYGAVMSISSAFAVGSVSEALTGFPSSNYSTHTWLLHINDYALNRYEMGYASALAVVLFIVMVLSWLLISKILSKFND
ncbi:MAG: carbohydrate ABC transporter permease [Acutalibacteraceae bacterium]